MIDRVNMSSLLFSVVAVGCTLLLTATQTSSQVSWEYHDNIVAVLAMLHNLAVLMVSTVWPDAMPQPAPYDGVDLQHHSPTEKRHFCATELGSRPQPDGGTELQRSVARIQHGG